MRIEDIIGSLEIMSIKGYRTVSYPIYGLLDKIHLNLVQCRYQPSCSQYAEQAIKEWGAYRGTLMAVKRIARCNPFGGYGSDPVLKKEDTHTHGTHEQK